jgi:hypothetical protein
MQDYLQPPSYCPDAIATDVGWINPRNGELLISVRNLRQKIAQKEEVVVREDYRSPTQKILDAMTEQLVGQTLVDDRSETQKVLDAITEQQISDTIQETVKRGRGRPKKVKEEENEQM